MPSRRKSRECALQMLFQWDMAHDSVEKVEKHYWSNTRPGSDDLLIKFANMLFAGSVEHIDEIDVLISSCTDHWRLERLAAVDRNIMRLSIFEMLNQPDTSTAVVINEALEIARKFSTPASAQFVNGVLDYVSKEISKQHSI